MKRSLKENGWIGGGGYCGKNQSFQEIRPGAGFESGDFVEDRLGGGYRRTTQQQQQQVSRFDLRACMHSLL